MTLAAPMRCSTLAEELGEPMIGTVEQRVRWLLVEDRSAWGTDAVGDVLGAELAGGFKAAGIRALLVRRREGDPVADAVRRLILVDTAARGMATRTVTSLAELDPARLAAVPLDEFGTPLDEPMFLVCSNGKRDACCAVRGRLLLSALAERHAERVWECTHLGGHRFAANLVCLPDGLVYGRVAAEDGPRLVDAYLAGRVDAAALRGRSSWPASAQVAERHVRMLAGLDGLTDVELVAAAVTGDRAEVTLRAAGSRHHVVLRGARAAEPRPTSCRADELDSPLHWEVG
jgi:(2Fe-2S) ferredoxin